MYFNYGGFNKYGIFARLKVDDKLFTLTCASSRNGSDLEYLLRICINKMRYEQFQRHCPYPSMRQHKYSHANGLASFNSINQTK